MFNKVNPFPLVGPQPADALGKVTGPDNHDSVRVIGGGASPTLILPSARIVNIATNTPMERLTTELERQ